MALTVEVLTDCSVSIGAGLAKTEAEYETTGIGVTVVCPV